MNNITQARSSVSEKAEIIVGQSVQAVLVREQIREIETEIADQILDHVWEFSWGSVLTSEWFDVPIEPFRVEDQQ